MFFFSMFLISRPYTSNDFWTKLNQTPWCEQSIAQLKRLVPRMSRCVPRGRGMSSRTAMRGGVILNEGNDNSFKMKVALLTTTIGLMLVQYR